MSLDEMVRAFLQGDTGALEEIARQTMLIAHALAGNAVRSGTLPASEVEDVGMAAAERAIAKIEEWDGTKATWSTYVGIITNTEIARKKNQFRSYRKQVLCGMENWTDNLDESDRKLAEEIRRGRVWHEKRKKKK